MKIVILQPMFFPWIGVFDQIHLSEVYIHLDDVQIPGGQSFIHRVQLKAPSQSCWWNAPIRRNKGLCKISEVELIQDPIWFKKSIRTFEQFFSGLPFKADAINLFLETFSQNFDMLSDFNVFSIELISDYLDIKTQFKKVKRTNCASDKTEKLIDILVPEKATTYISGLGGVNYLDKEVFKKQNIKLEFMNYQNKEYPQKFGPFNPYVSVLHPIAALGKEAKNLLISTSQERL